MNYPNGEEISVGDKVKLWQDCYGVVVASIDAGKFSTGYSKEEWGYLKGGILIISEEAGLIHYLEPEKSLELIQRAVV